MEGAKRMPVLTLIQNLFRIGAVAVSEKFMGFVMPTDIQERKDVVCSR
jgi:hypothetical protein